MTESHKPTMVACAKAVCSWCAGHSFPDDKAPLCDGPPGSGNFCHRLLREDGETLGDYLCSATGIWVDMRWHWGMGDVRANSPRGWVDGPDRPGCMEGWKCSGAVCQACGFCQRHAHEANRQGEGYCGDCSEVKEAK